ncbi:MAG: cell division protein FtsB [Parasphingorhabdus sp.]|jgi:cell division protein FtsB
MSVKKPAKYILGAYILLMAFVLIAGENGMIEYSQLQSDLQNAEARNQRLSNRNQRLLVDVVDIKNRVEAVEELARFKLGMIKRDEVFYHVID